MTVFWGALLGFVGRGPAGWWRRHKRRVLVTGNTCGMLAAAGLWGIWVAAVILRWDLPAWMAVPIALSGVWAATVARVTRRQIHRAREGNTFSPADLFSSARQASVATRAATAQGMTSIRHSHRLIAPLNPAPWAGWAWSMTIARPTPGGQPLVDQYTGWARTRRRAVQAADDAPRRAALEAASRGNCTTAPPR